MLVIKKPEEISELTAEFKKLGHSVGFVPTMGALHAGHLSLIKQAKTNCEKCIVSIYINPTQFGPDEDLETYPRKLAKDIVLLESEEVDILFLPDNESMYPEGYNTFVTVSGLTNVLCGKSRPEHFKGVTTIVCKLLNIVQPDTAVFGEKDFQQAAVIKKMVKDLNIPVIIETGSIIREADNVAMSSRNKYLSTEERKQAVCLYKSLQTAKKIAEDSGKLADIKEAIRKIINSAPLANIDYIELVDPCTMKTAENRHGDVLAAIAVFFGKTRLIDNILLPRQSHQE